jgi:hypothetical protein
VLSGILVFLKNQGLRQLNPMLRVSNLKDVLDRYRHAESFAQHEEGLRRAKAARMTPSQLRCSPVAIRCVLLLLLALFGPDRAICRSLLMWAGRTLSGRQLTSGK